MSARVTPMKASTARDLRLWLGANDLTHQNAVSMAVLQAAITSAESRTSCRPLKKNCANLLLLSLAAHALTSTLLFRHHSNSSYPNLAHKLGLWTVVVSAVVLALGVVSTAMKRTMPRKLKCYGIPAGVTVNMAVVVTLFGLQEGKKRAYEGQGRTLAVYSLVVSCLLFLALVFGTAGYCVRKGLEEREGRIRLDEEAE